MFLHSICWSVFCFRFPTNRISFYVGSRMGVGIGGEASVCCLCYMLVPFARWISHKLDFVLSWVEKNLRG